MTCRMREARICIRQPNLLYPLYQQFQADKEDDVLDGSKSLSKAASLFRDHNQLGVVLKHRLPEVTIETKLS